ncbi:MAG: NTP transferase domain-containing protein [Treponema sp.]|jgi:spore coat polysaccharide biosynthesis protein SpsF|nr:NTP transferase domain-containing protein [Treponema sp.]
MMTAVILQARLDSTRLPGKSLLPLGGKPLILLVMEALKGVWGDRYVLACPEDCVRAFGPWAEQAGFDLVAGSKEDVLSRYCAAVRRFGIDRLIRATGDNPFVFVDAANTLNQEALNRKADYAGYSGLPYGAGVESVAAEALLKAEQDASFQAEREHVCPYLYTHPDLFRLHRPLAPLVWQAPSLRISLDTPEDYRRAQVLFEALAGFGEERFQGETIIAAYRRSCNLLEGELP